MTDVTLDTKWGTPSRLHDPYALANFQPRCSDVLIVTAPKAGTTWMQQILHQLRSGGDTEFTSIFQVVPWLEKPAEHEPWQQRLARYEQIPNPRIFKTHCTYEQTPGVDVAKIVLSSRDPRDCCVSFYHHMMGMNETALQRYGIQQPDSFDVWIDQWLNFASWYRNVQSWWPHIDNSNLLWLRYEDMKADLSASLDQLLTFLRWSITTEQRLKVLELCNIGWMRAHESKFILHTEGGEPTFKAGGFVRKGTVGDYQTLLSTEQEARILAKARQMLTPECLRFLALNVEAG
ncbi:MAG: sulfotransferase domain-containing protein [Gammaproteobacteria bacterium]|nr:sulfotransferase domain-containing protein [Gammaproteobacteria bacterium]